MKKPLAASEASPYKSVAEELERLRKAFRVLSQRYTARVETEITTLRDTILAAADADAGPDAASPHASSPVIGKKPVRENPGSRKAAAAVKQADKIHDLRDMLTLLRTFEISSGVAKRRDFKLVENVLEELQLLARHWA